MYIERTEGIKKTRVDSQYKDLIPGSGPEPLIHEKLCFAYVTVNPTEERKISR
jgi:hypothetical protein